MLYNGVREPNSDGLVITGRLHCQLRFRNVPSIHSENEHLGRLRNWMKSIRRDVGKSDCKD